MSSGHFNFNYTVLLDLAEKLNMEISGIDAGFKKGKPSQFLSFSEETKTKIKELSKNIENIAYQISEVSDLFSDESCESRFLDFMDFHKLIIGD